MRTKVWGTTAVALALWCGSAICAMGEDSPNLIGGKFGLTANLGYGSYAMADWNKFIDETNHMDYDNLHYRGDIPHITGGFCLQGGAQFAITDNLIIGAEVESLSAETQGTLSRTNDIWPSDNGTDTYDFSLPLLAIGGFVKGALPVGENLLLTGGVGVESLSLKGKIEYTASTSSGSNAQTVEISGSGTGYKFLIGGEYFFNQVISLGVDLGYRTAKIGKVHFKNTTYNYEDDLKNSNGSYMSVDYSGVFAQGGIRLYF